MEGTRFCLELDDDRIWRWYCADAEGKVIATSVKNYSHLTDVVQAIDDLRLVFSAV